MPPRLFHQGGARSRVSLCCDDDALVVTVADDGPGIPEDAMPLLFEPFFTTKAAGEGTGLGLSISRKIVVAHGGELEVSSEVGRGTRFSVRLPLSSGVLAGFQSNLKISILRALVAESAGLVIECGFELPACRRSGVGRGYRPDEEPRIPKPYSASAGWPGSPVAAVGAGRLGVDSRRVQLRCREAAGRDLHG